MNKRNTIIALVCTLLIGLILGFFGAGRLAKKRMDKFHSRMEKPQEEREFLSQRLELDEDQRNQVFPVLDSMLEVQLELRKKHRAEMEMERQKMFDIISTDLDDHQKKKIKKMRAHGKKRRPHRPHPRR